MIEFRVLGTLDVVRDGGHVAIPSARQRALLTRLLLSRGQVVPTDALIDAAWPEVPPREARHALHTQLSRLRSTLGPGVLGTRSPGYLLSVGTTTLDADEFEAAVARAGGLLASAPAQAISTLEAALARWRGPAYAEFATSFATAAAARLDQLRLTAIEHLADALLHNGAAERAGHELARLVADHPLRERPHALLMRAYARTGRQADALSTYHVLRHRLAEELGVDPSPELQQEYRHVLQHAAPTTSPPAPPSPEASSGPAAPVPPAPTPIPTPGTSLIGRDEQLARLADLIGQHRLVTLVGPGGVGKTRVAQELVGQLAGGRVWWVDLAAAQQPADVPYRVIDALGLPQPAGRDMDEFLVDVLGGASGVLVADNCEHVIAPVAGLLSRIVASCPAVVVLATSREPLDVDGEQVLPVPPLPDPTGDPAALREAPAVALFADRLATAGAGELAAEELPAVAAICRQVGGLPLAIELAAARARSLGIAAVAERPPLSLLTAGRRTGPARHRGLRAVLDWSYHLLDPDEEVLFRRLAVFRGRFTLGDTDQICADGVLAASAIAPALAGLVDKSMVSGPAGGGYRLLAPTRAYAAERLAAHGEAQELARAHARHYIAVAERAGAALATREEGAAVATLTGCVDELRAAHQWACGNDADLAIRLVAAVAPYASYHLRFELQDWAADAAALPSAQRHPLRAVALASAATGAWARGEFDTAERLARAGLAATGDQQQLAAPAMLVLGDVALLAGRFHDAAGWYRQAAALAGDRYPHVACEAFGGQALVAGHRGDLATAQEYAAASGQVAARSGAPGLRAMACYFAGEVRLTSAPAEAWELLEQARRLAVAAGALLVEGFAILSSVSLRARAADDPVQACAAFREAIEHWRRVGNQTQQWLTLRNLLPALVRAGYCELACTVHGALASAPVRLPADVVVPEAAALDDALAEARQRLGERASRAATVRGADTALEDLVAIVLATIGPRPEWTVAQAGSSR